MAQKKKKKAQQKEVSVNLKIRLELEKQAQKPKRVKRIVSCRRPNLCEMMQKRADCESDLRVPAAGLDSLSNDR